MNSGGHRTPFINEVITGLIVSIAISLYLRGAAVPFVVLIFLWLAIFRQRVMTVAGAILIALVTSPGLAERPIEFLIVVLLILAGLVVELFVLIGVPAIRGQTIHSASVVETTVFYVLGVAIAYLIQMSFCGIAMRDIGPFNLLRLQSLILKCQGQEAISAAVCLRWVLQSSVFWGCTMVVLRRLDFHLQKLSQFPGLFLRAVVGWFAALILPILFRAAIEAYPELILPGADINAPPFQTIYSYSYTVLTVLLAAFGTSIATRKQ